MKLVEQANQRAGLWPQSTVFVVPRLNGEDFQIEKSIGEGVFGIVALAKSKRTNEMVALKRIDKVNEKVNVSIRDCWNQEIQSGSKLVEHEGIARLKGYFETSRHFWLVLELVEGVSLYQILEERNFSPLEESQAKNLFFSTCFCCLLFSLPFGCSFGLKARECPHYFRLEDKSN